MKPATAEAMQWRALGSRLLERKPALIELGGGIALPDRPLARAEHADVDGPPFFSAAFHFSAMMSKACVPGDRRELAVLVELAVLHAQQRLGQPVLAVHDLGQEIALDAVEAAVDRRIGIALGGDDAAVLGADEHAAAGAAEAARRPCPSGCRRSCRRGRLSRRPPAQARRRSGSSGDGARLDHVAAGKPLSASMRLSCAVMAGLLVKRDRRGGLGRLEMVVDERCRDDAVEAVDLGHGVECRRTIGVLDRDDQPPAVGALVHLDPRQSHRAPFRLLSSLPGLA